MRRKERCHTEISLSLLCNLICLFSVESALYLGFIVSCTQQRGGEEEALLLQGIAYAYSSIFYWSSYCTYLNLQSLKEVLAWRGQSGFIGSNTFHPVTISSLQFLHRSSLVVQLWNWEEEGVSKRLNKDSLLALSWLPAQWQTPILFYLCAKLRFI